MQSLIRIWIQIDSEELQLANPDDKANQYVFSPLHTSKTCARLGAVLISSLRQACVIYNPIKVDILKG